MITTTDIETRIARAYHRIIRLELYLIGEGALGCAQRARETRLGRGTVEDLDWCSELEQALLGHAGSAARLRSHTARALAARPGATEWS